MEKKIRPEPLIAEKMLFGKPGPHYLTGELQVGADNRSLEATAVFPSTDPTIGERGHVNVAHYLFGLWNAAHVLAELNGYENTLSLDGNWDAHKIASPDMPMKLNVSIVDPDIRSKVVKGTFIATYSVDDEVYGEFTTTFFAQKAQ